MVRILTLDVDAEFEKPLRSDFPESLMRGGLGYTIRKMVCINRKVKDCADCLIVESCLFSLMYNEKGKTRNGLQVSPYALHCVLNEENNAAMTLRIILFEPLIPYAAHLVLALAEAGKSGVGKDRTGFNIKKTINPSDGHEYRINVPGESFKPVSVEWAPAMIEGQAIKTCVINFISPTRIKHDSDMKRSISFGDIIKSCVMRFKNLERAFSAGTTSSFQPAADIINSALGVTLTEERIEWEKKERYSKKQDSTVSVGGFTGEIIFSGNTVVFKEFLDFGIAAGIGKSTSFGCGKFLYNFKD